VGGEHAHQVRQVDGALQRELQQPDEQVDHLEYNVDSTLRPRTTG